jgi:F-type H+-transporting ATPase subunit b
MNLDLTTLVLQTINFLVLLWLLTRFLYRPLQAALDARQAAAVQRRDALAAREAALTRDTAALQAERDAVQAQRNAALQALTAEIAAERQRRLDALRQELDTERAQARARDTQRRTQEAQTAQTDQRRQAAGHVAQYLQRLASPAVEAAVIDLLLADLAGPQREAARSALHGAVVDAAATVEIETAFEVPPDLSARVQAALSALCGCTLTVRWRREPALQAGIRIQPGGHASDYALEASLRRGVDAFVQAAA